MFCGQGQVCNDTFRYPSHIAYDLGPSLGLHVACAVQKETPYGADDLLEHYGLSGIYKWSVARGHDTYLKELPADLDYRRYTVLHQHMLGHTLV